MKKETAIWVSPGRLSGRPCLMGHRIPTEIIADIAWNVSVAEAMDSYGINRAQSPSLLLV